jgi:hypothetical protein
LSTSSNVLNDLIEQKLLSLHTAFFAKVISVSGNNAKIQPLNMIKANGKQAKKQAVMTVPILKNVRKFATKTVTITTEMDDKFSITIPTVSTISSGDIVYCACGEREITDNKKGKFSVPTTGHHRMSDAVIIGVI